MPRQRKRRKDLKGSVPCIKCSTAIELSIYECTLPGAQTRSAYWSDKWADATDVVCPGCGAKQSIRMNIIVTLIS